MHGLPNISTKEGACPPPPPTHPAKKQCYTLVAPTICDEFATVPIFVMDT